MKIFGFYVTRENFLELYLKKCSEVIALEHYANRTKRESNEVHSMYNNLQKAKTDIETKLYDAEQQLLFRDDDIKELRSRLEDANSANAEISERLEKEQSDNCELQNLYAEKCKECDALKGGVAFVDGREVVVVNEQEYNQLKADAEKFRADREKHNANRRRRRAAKKVAHAKPE